MSKRIEKISDAEKLLLSQTWSTIGSYENSYDFAIKIYEAFFKLSPDAVVLFTSIDPNNVDLRQNQQFRTMALRLVQIISSVVRNLGKIETIQHTFVTLGKKHVNYSNNGFTITADHWTSMQTAIIDCIMEAVNDLDLDQDSKRSVGDAWTMVIADIIQVMEESFNAKKSK